MKTGVVKKIMNERPYYLIAEYCRGPFYMGWHLYLRESMDKNKRNSNGSWGWIRRPKENKTVIEFLNGMGITIQGDGTCDYDGIADIAKRHAIPRQRIGGRPRGCIIIDIDDKGQINRAKGLNDGKASEKEGPERQN